VNASFFDHAEKTRDHFHMSKGQRVDPSRISAIELAHLDEDELGILGQEIEMMTQRLNRAMRLVTEAMQNRRRAS